MVQGKLKLNANKRSKVNHKNPGAKTRKGAPPKGQTKDMATRRMQQMKKKQAGKATEAVERHIAGRLTSNEKDSLKLLKAPAGPMTKSKTKTKRRK